MAVGGSHGDVHCFVFGSRSCLEMLSLLWGLPKLCTSALGLSLGRLAVERVKGAAEVRCWSAAGLTVELAIRNADPTPWLID
ncbi:hypothetical protein chiPu_0025135 [Chiloscyllium punctatum]|uniref:Uncharacterized protein n=1 Tax=Chiloscyllium punctatum TaxID=137246 RepID=A0A401TET7_CHIPU|nr:hypothetical protein [Chiloscyllium punctatum]